MPSSRPTPASASSGRVRIDRSSDASGAAFELDADAYTAGDTIVMPQHHGPLDRGRGQALLAHELVHVGQQRRLGASLPAEHTGAGQDLEREAQSAESLVERVRSAPPAASLPLARTARQHAAPALPSRHTSEVRQATQLALASGPRAAADASVELPPTSSPGAPATPQRAALSSAAGPSVAAASDRNASPAKPGDEQEFEELARQLYERLRLRFKRELLLDRERSGFLADSR
jgi:hypothetical protein